MRQEPSRPSLLVVVVLYKQTAGQSPAFNSLHDLLWSRTDIAADISCAVFDNSATPSALPELPVSCSYSHNAANPGLAGPYQQALDHALAEDIDWLLLLDQDTAVTSAYLQEVATTLAEVELRTERICALAPKLIQDGDVLSPHWPSFQRNRGSFLPRNGVQEREIAVFNSGSVLRTSALAEIGGFPPEFPLDFLDHAVFRQLQRRGWNILLLRSTLQHHLASKGGDFELEFRDSARLQSIVRAQSRFYRRYGTLREKAFHNVRRGLMAVKLFRKGQPREALLLLRFTLQPR